MTKYDFAVIGAGGSGLAAAMYAARLSLKTVVFGASSGTDLPVGGLITTTHLVENYPGIKQISGFELAKKLEEHAKSYEKVTVKQEKVESVRKKGKCFFIKTNKGEYQAGSILIATGRKVRKLDIPGSKEFENKGVNYCALCDGPLYKGKVVAVVGGSDSAAIEALILSEHAKKVYIIYRGEKIRAEPINLEKIKQNKKIEIITNTNVTKIKGEDFVEGVFLDKKFKGKNELALDGVYVAIGHEPMNELARELGVELDKDNHIKIDHANSQTNVEGVFAAGDITNRAFKQLITGVAEGCTAAYYAYKFLSKKKLKECKEMYS